MTGARRFGLSLAVLAGALVLTIGTPWKTVAADPAEVTACSVQKTKGGLKAFVRAFNRGNLKKLDVLFDDEPGFQWYSMGPPTDRSGQRAFRRSTLVGFFRKRHRVNDRLHIRYFGGIFMDHGGPEYQHATHYSFNLSRRVDGFRGGRWFWTVGKGALVCAGNQPRIIVMSIGGRNPMGP